MSAEQRQWNVVATLLSIVVLVYVIACTAGFLIGRVDAATFKDMVLPVVAAVGGYFAAVLKRSDTT